MREGFKPTTAEDLIRMYDLNGLAKERKQIKQQNKEVSVLVKDFAETINEQIKELEDQVDGKISTWFFSGIPSAETEPEVNWTTDEEKAKHIGDIYYDQDTGNSYTYMYVDGKYQWTEETVGDVSEVLAIANKAQDTADRKRQIFVIEPYPPYEVGDMWIKEDKDIYRCRAKRTGGEFSNNDWVLASDYTNDDYAKGVEAQLNVYKEVVSTDYVLKSTFETSNEGIISEVSSLTTIVEKVNVDVQELTETTENIDGTLSGMQEDIANNKTDIENTKQDLLGELDKKASVENVTTVLNEVKNLQTSNSQTIQILEEIQTNGVTQVKTENNYTFNKEGLIIEETGAKTKGIFDNKGVDIIDTQGNRTDLLYAGYVDEEKAKSNEKLKQFEGQTVVYSDNMYVGNYLMIGTHSRLEDFENETKEGIKEQATGVFWLGG